MTNEFMSISGKETKKHILEALKAVFPGFKFSATSEYDSVCVRWLDGPLADDVQKVLNRFVSYTRILDRSDSKQATGYEWKGQLYIGARYLSTVRTFTDERREALIAYMADGGANYLDAKVFERIAAEREMIREGKLEGIEPKHRPDLMLDSAPVIDRRQKKTDPPASVKENAFVPDSAIETPKQLAEVIPLFSPKRIAQIQVDQFFDSLTPEQMLKLKSLEMFLGKQTAATMIEATGKTIDEIFSLAAAEIFG